VKVLVDVPEDSIGAVSVGDRMSFTVHASASQAFTGTVSFVAEAADPMTSSFRVELETRNPDRALRPGMIAEVTVVRAVREDALVVPLAAVVPRRGDHLVFLVEGGRAAQRVVRLERIVGSEAVVASGLEPGERVIVSGQRTVEDGQLIEIEPAAAP
jgi:membrane fusion protein (multidrug efflux system)